MCLVTIGSYTLIGPNVNLYSATHPLDLEVCNGLKGLEMGREIHIGDNVWIGDNVGRGAVLGAGNVVTKDVTPYIVVVGNQVTSEED
jgi:acetyltransferase-like isoleucine patch superfamily enzyme